MKKENENEMLILLGDFNAHNGTTGTQSIDHNGKMLQEWLNNQDLIMLNYDNRCKGEITWKRGKQKSTIDYIMVNEIMYDQFIDMNIDEEEEIFERSDHNLLTARFQIKRQKN